MRPCLRGIGTSRAVRRHPRRTRLFLCTLAFVFAPETDRLSASETEFSVFRQHSLTDMPGGAKDSLRDIAGLYGFHTLRGAYSNARGIDLDEVSDLPRPAALGAVRTKKGFWFTSYAIQQYIVQSEHNPAIGWGLFALATLSDGNPSPVKWSVLAGLGGNNLLPGRDNDRWGMGFFHFGFAEPLLGGLAALNVNRRGESGFEAFYNFAITPWLRLSGDLQVIAPWNSNALQATYVALRLQTKF
jgi:porin